MRIRWLQMTIAGLAVSAGAQQTRPASLSDLLPYVGVYRVGTQRELAISIQESPSGPMLLFADINSGDVRILFPVGPSEFAAGPELLRPDPPRFRTKFYGRVGAPADSLVLSGEAWPHRATGRRVAVRAETVRFRSGVTMLEGTLLHPAGNARAPLIVLANGSEDNDRHSFGPIPYVLADHGIAVFMYDKRGTGASTGSWQSAGLDELADDLVAAIVALKSRRDIEPKHIGVLGFSEGGWIAPLASSRSTDIRFIVAISGGGTTKGATFIYKDRRRLMEAGLNGHVLDSALAASEATIAASLERVHANDHPSGFDRRVAYDPTDHWAAFTGPVLYVGGEYDVLDDARESADALRAIFARSGNSDATVVVLPKGHHFPFLGITGLPSEWGRFKGVTQTVPGFWDILIRWTEARSRV